jgi:hypothetical protein
MALVRHHSALFQDQLQAPYIGDVLERIGGDHNDGCLLCAVTGRSRNGVFVDERGGVGIRLEPAAAIVRRYGADPTSIATWHDEAIAHMAIALRLITLAFGPASIRNRS